MHIINYNIVVYIFEKMYVINYYILLYSTGQLPHRENSKSCKKTLFGIYPGAKVEDHGRLKQGNGCTVTCTVIVAV